MTESLRKAKSEYLVDLVRALAWPFVALFVMFSFWKPLHRTAELLPSVLDRSDSISIGGISLEVGSHLRSKATPEVLAAISATSTSGIRKMLDTGGDIFFDNDNYPEERANVQELMRLHLYREATKSEIVESNAGIGTANVFTVGYVRTQLGTQVHDFMATVIAEFVQQISVQPDKEPQRD